MVHSPSREVNSHSAIQKLPAFYGTQSFIIIFTTARHLSLSRARCLQSTSFHPIPLRSFLTLTSHLHLGLPSDFFPSVFPTKILYCTALHCTHFSSLPYVLHSPPIPSHPDVSKFMQTFLCFLFQAESGCLLSTDVQRSE